MGRPAVASALLALAGLAAGPPGASADCGPESACGWSVDQDGHGALYVSAGYSPTRR